MLNWSQQFNIFCFTNNCGYASPLGFKTLLACGAKKQIKLNENSGFEEIQIFMDSNPEWLFGHFNYEAGRENTQHLKDRIGFAPGFLFAPEYLISITENIVEFINCPESTELVFNKILNFSEQKDSQIYSLEIKSNISKVEYLEAINKIKNHIQKGDCYEINFCQEFYSSGKISPVKLYIELSEISPNPFSAFYRIDDKYCLCQSPERFIKKEGSTIISQPIKGTIARGKNEIEDRKNLLTLQNSEKDKTENVMIVDLVRNDFSKVCIAGSVKVDELFAIKSFPGVHQMISTIKGELNNEVKFSEIFSATFPMGSMTGAPKIKVMELINFYETSARGLFSGTIGYIEPNGDFDFNVVIRSLFYNSSTENISFLAGGGITISSDAESEFEESMLKANTLRNALINK
ncbi:MAG: anthranilate synthase component I family protein [Ferruginibacter sp.]